MKPITPFDSFPSFGNGGSRSAPGDAKYALGFVPADTFPAEWANYFFHGATKGVSDLNSAVTSLWNEMASVLSNYNITPDATDNDQLLECLTKLKSEAALAAHPVGSLYWTSSSDNPATTFGGGTWVQIKDKFILAAGDTYTNGDTGGSATVTLTTDQIPSHTHSGTTDDGGVDHSHGFSGTTGGGGGHSHTVYTGVINVGGSTPYGTSYYGGAYGTVQTGNTNYQDNHYHSYSGSTGGASAYNHKHGFTTGSVGGGQAHNNMPPYIVKFCWERTA